MVCACWWLPCPRPCSTSLCCCDVVVLARGGPDHMALFLSKTRTRTHTHTRKYTLLDKKWTLIPNTLLHLSLHSLGGGGGGGLTQLWQAAWVMILNHLPPPSQIFLFYLNFFKDCRMACAEKSKCNMHFVKMEKNHRLLFFCFFCFWVGFLLQCLFFPWTVWYTYLSFLERGLVNSLFIRCLKKGALIKSCVC